MMMALPGLIGGILKAVQEGENHCEYSAASVAKNSKSMKQEISVSNCTVMQFNASHSAHTLY